LSIQVSWSCAYRKIDKLHPNMDDSKQLNCKYIRLNNSNSNHDGGSGAVGGGGDDHDDDEGDDENNAESSTVKQSRYRPEQANRILGD